jgi:hypothetical protein
MKYNLYILFILLTISTFGQIDTTKSIYKNLETKKFYSVGMCETTKNGVTEYQVNGKKVNAKVYKKYHKTWKNMETCTPCILMSYDENDILIRKSVCYTDCGVGQYITHAKATVWQTSKLLQKRSLRERQLFSLCKSPLNIYLC